MQFNLASFKKNIYFTLAAAMTVGALSAGAAQPNGQKPVGQGSPDREDMINTVLPIGYLPFGDTVAKPEAPEEKIRFTSGDLSFNLGGSFDVSSYHSDNTTLLNDFVPESYEFFKQTADVTFEVLYGNKTFGFDILEFFLDMRQKLVWGNTGKSLGTTSVPTKFEDIVIKAHKHSADRPILWARTLYLDLNLNALFCSSPDKDYKQNVRFGLFPFMLGRGISLGSLYGLGREFLGIYTGYQNEQHAPGINLYGTLWKDILEYDLYYSKLEEKSDSFGETFNHIRANQVGRQATPYRGSHRDNDLYAARIKLLPLGCASDCFGDLELEPYVMYNRAEDRKIEFEADASSRLGTYGLAFEYENGGFGVGFEVAKNFGHEKVRNIDRNVIRVAKDDTGSIVERYSHVVTGAGTDAPVTPGNETIVQASQETENGAALSGGLTNKDNRFRPEYQVDYNGFMGIVDASYEFKSVGLMFAGAFGYASGDENPHTTEESKEYDGFIGLQEGYAGTRVPSLFILDSRKTRRPLTERIGFIREAGDDESFTDLVFVGGGLTWDFEKCFECFPFSFNTNVLGFWKEFDGRKFDATLGQLIDEKADSYLGLEFNIHTSYKLQKNLVFYGDFAFFFPGGFYDDVQGLPLRGDIFRALDVPDNTGFDSANYRLGTDNAWFVNIGIRYKF